MTDVTGFLVFVLTALFIAGLIKPNLILFWSKKPTRWKLFTYWFIGSLFIGMIGAITMDSEEVAMQNVKVARELINQEKYDGAKLQLQKIEPGDSLYTEAQGLIAEIDSLEAIRREKNRLAAKVAAEKKAKEEKEKQREQLIREIESFNKGIDFSKYRGSVEMVQMEVILFGSWANVILKAEKSGDPEILRLASQLKTKVINTQIRELPKIRKAYADAIDKKLWENDIDVSVTGRGNKYIVFVGGLFSTNKNKKDFQTQVQDVLKTFRFTQARYKWYESESEYTYWEMDTPNDSELWDFKD